MSVYRRLRCVVRGGHRRVVLPVPAARAALVVCRRCLAGGRLPLVVPTTGRDAAVDALGAALVGDWPRYAEARGQADAAGFEALAVSLLHAHDDPAGTLRAVDLAWEMSTLDGEVGE